MNAFWTYVGQILNFLIFIAILHYLLYKPVSRIMKKRRDEMASDLKEAEEKVNALRFCGYVRTAQMDIHYALANQDRLRQDRVFETLCEGEPYVPEENE